MNVQQRKVVLDVSLVERFDASGSLWVKIEHVKDALGDDKTLMFRAFGARTGFDLTKRPQVEDAAGKFAEEFASVLP
jgi:hypothetical protein